MSALLESLYEVSRSFDELMELERLVPRIVRTVREALGADGGAVLLLDRDRDELYFPYSAEAHPDVDARLGETRVPLNRGIAGWVVRQGTAEVVADAPADPRWYPEVDRHTGMVTRSLLTAPLRSRSGIIGCIQLRGEQPNAFSAAHLDFLEAIAQSVAIAIENARLYDRLRASEHQLRGRVAVLSREIAAHAAGSQLVGDSAAMRRVAELIRAASGAPVTVLVQGETGTGKEIVARAIHDNGPRQGEPFVVINCSALSETLLEGELFGYRKGAFTGAIENREGLFAAAHRGTIFLDEVAEMSPAMQAKLLRTLESGEVMPVGERTPRWVDVRVISATHRDLAAEVDAGRFRRDLFYRLHTFPIVLPPLRERREDIPLLATHVLRQAAGRLGKPVPDIDRWAMEALCRYAWPGNVRELRNELERAAVLAAPHTAITLADLSPHVARGSQPVPEDSGHGDPDELRVARARFEANHIRAVLARCGGNVSRAARALGISRSGLHTKVVEYGIRPADLDPVRDRDDDHE